jgi:dihydrofolate reductase
MNIALVVAASENNVIGKNNQLLWRLPNDMKFFKNTTWGMPVIMGRKTFESLGKPLAGRTNIVITRQENWNAPGVQVVKSLDDAIVAAADTDAKESFVIGGGEIYKQAMPLAQRIYLTRVHGTFEGDTYFPVVEEQQWELLSNLDFPADEKHAYSYSFQVWAKR